MARRRALATFNDDVARRIRFEREARKKGLAFSSCFAGRPRRLIYRIPIVVPVYDESRTLTITMGASAHPSARPPLVLIDGPVCRRHRFPDTGGLCMWWCEDPDDERWVPDDGLLALVGHAIDHAYCEVHCQQGHPWPKPEAPRRHREGCPTCRPQQ